VVTAGIDVGTETTKAVVLSNNKIVSWQVLIGGDEDAAVLGLEALNQAAAKAGMKPADIQHLVATGLGGIQLPFVNEQVPEAMCIAKGIDWLLPSTRIALDLGAAKSIAVKCHHGSPTKIARNDKCASGTGVYLEIVSHILGIGIGEMAELSLKSKENVELQSMCAVFAESEAISLIQMKKRPEDIAKGALRGLAKKTYPLLLEVGLERDVALLGGVAQNRGLVIALEELCGHNLLVPPEPQIVAALGASLIAQGRIAS
jgi:predicted CoA-substrate-specific enzyme activase